MVKEREINDLREMLFDLIIQSCANNDGIVDNMCMSAYENATAYLAKHGYLDKINDRMYRIIHEGADV